MSTSILVADDEPDIVFLLTDRLRQMGYEVIPAYNGREALALFSQKAPQLVLLDIEMPGMNGIEVLKQIRKVKDELPVVIMTAYGSINLAVDAMKHGATDFMTKPFDVPQLESVIKKALERKAIKSEVFELLGSINHEIKNLLMPVVMGTSLLETEIHEVFARLPQIEAVKAEASHKLCDEILDLLRSAGKRLQGRSKEIADCVKGMSRPPEFKPCAIRSIVDDVFKALSLPADARSVTLRQEGLDAIPTVEADGDLLFNAFYNLVNNAIPEVPAGGFITVSAGDHSDSEVVIKVTDTGKGMSPEVRDSLFSERTISRKAGGTGLGTKIVRDVIQAHRGEITVHSEPGQGTTFTIRIPVQQAT